MEIEALDKNGYRLLRIKEDLRQSTDLTELKFLLASHIDDEVKNLAFSFTEKSYFYSRTIAILTQFLGTIKERNGQFALIHPNNGMLEMIRVVGLNKLMGLYVTEDELVDVYEHESEMTEN
jgi:hypothetical protein